MLIEVGNARFELHLGGKPIAEEVALVFVIHGRLGSRAKVKDICEQITAQCNAPLAQTCSVVAVSFDAPNHGESVLNIARNKTLVEGNPTHPLDMYSQVSATVDILRMALDFLPVRLGCCLKSAIVTGVSQGGHAAFLAFTHEPRFACCVAWIGTGNFHQLMVGRVTARETQYPPALERIITQRDAIRNLSNLVDRHLCLINGSQDDLVPASLNAELVEKLRPLYKTPSKLAFITYPVGHTVTPEMVRDGINFVEAFLKSRHEGSL